VAVSRSADAFFAAVDEAQERKYGAVDRSRWYCTAPDGRNTSAVRCACDRLLTDNDLKKGYKSCWKCRQKMVNDNGRRKCAGCGTEEKRTTATNRVGKVYLCEKCRKPDAPWYLEWKAGR